MDDIQKFFFGKNTVRSLSEAECAQSRNYLETLRAVSRLTYMSMYVIDYQLKEFEYVSDNPFFLCGHTPEEVMKLGYAFYFKHVSPEDLEMLIKVNEIGFNFFDRIPLTDRKSYSISYDFHLLNAKEKILVNHKLTPIFITEEGKIWKALCLVSLSANTYSGNIILSKEGEDSFWELNISNAEWHKMEKMKLTDRELQILRLHAQGLTISQIALQIFISIDTVKFHRKKLFDKLHVKNIAEALAYATNNKLL
ncbi:helix-turn-helix transcriptional regulator [Chryseobacterium gotjawalense]|uniref:Helix-turn-helix transcriptional regulator n=1 Tax=Chryseobacterium gotjawalense TaxID=3042315 RepID=A0ABY8RBX1_9FLAO|nr:helix-turn-helix transcriptional regulator [Chryseobacterium sp. wdc7]WHF51461.1 helix-turn-helix transcriptional regulator [Chryseobacterium sp. wdc7]